MKILFFGLGSIGKRHAKLLLENFDHELFAFRTNKGQEKNELDIHELYSWSEIDKRSFDIVFVANPTNLHIDTAIKCAERGMALFIEKPIDSRIDGLDNLLSLVEAKDLTTYVAYPLRFHPVLKELKGLLKGKKIFHSRMVCASYLPDWRPEQDHLKGYSALKDMGGGVLMDLSHELDYATYLFGNIDSIEGKFGKISNVTVDSEDYADLLVEHAGSMTNIHLSYVSHKPQRCIEVNTEDGYIMADLINNIIVYSERDGVWDKGFEIGKDDMYLRQLNYFLSNITNKRMSNNLFEASRLFRQIVEFRDSL